MRKIDSFIFFCAIGVATFSYAQENASEDPFLNKNSSKETISSRDFEKELSEKSEISQSEKSETEKDRLQIGGYLSSELDYARFNSLNFISTPNTLSLYLDSKLRHDIRAYVLGRLIFNPSNDDKTVSPLTGQTLNKNTLLLDEMKLMFNLENYVFLTVGKQKIKWGASKFWNPTDTLNQTQKDLFKSEDNRSGISMVKANIPIFSSNLYLFGVLDNVTTAEQTKFAARFELPISSAEFSTSFVAQKDKKSVFNFDTSFAFFDFDFYSEFSYSRGSNGIHYSNGVQDNSYENKDILKSSVGGNYEWKYNDKNTLIFGAEYFYNGDGYSNNKNYLTVILKQLYVPYYLSQNYLMGSVIAQNIFGWNDTNMSIFHITNVTDHSNILRFQWNSIFYRDLNVFAAVGYHYGNSNGEFTLLDQKLDASVQVKVNI